MAIKSKLIHFKKYSDFNSKKLSANDNNTTYTVGVGGSVLTGSPEVLFQSICWIQDERKMWTHGTLYNCADADLSGYLTEEQIAEIYATSEELDGKQDKGLKFTDVAASTWVEDSTYSDYAYRCDMVCEGVTADMYAEVVFAVTEATGGDYSPVCETGDGIVSIWSKAATEIVVPTVVITK